MFVLPFHALADVPDVDWPVETRPAAGQLEEKVSVLESLIGDIEAAGLDASYARSALALAKDFIGYAADDERNGRPGRAAYVRSYLDGALDAAAAEARALLKDPALNRPVPRPPLRDIAIRGGAFYSGDFPIMFGGMGHFGQVRRDIPKFPDYGFNLIQIEIGPNSVVKGPNPEDIDTGRITDDILAQLDAAAEHGLMINLLLSPHYFPGWALELYPELGRCGHGFIKYCASDERAREVIRRFLEVLIPMIKDKPALQSYTLANEPAFDERNGPAGARFPEFLKEKYGDVERLNKVWNKKYKDFSDVRIGDDMLSLCAAARLDWSEFHNAAGTAFFRWMTDVIREMDPRTPVHIKFMDNMFENNETAWGIGREALEEFTEISGNDSTIRYPGENGYGLRYHQNAAFFDFLKSLQPDKPIQNSENHVISDDSPLFYPEEAVYSAMMIQYLHGMGASTMWVWERGDGVSLGNNVLSRPNCAAAVARATLDARRLAPEIISLSNAPGARPAEQPVAVYYSNSSRALQFDFLEKWRAGYELALYLGRPVRILTDRMMEAGPDPADVRVLIIPEYIYETEKLYRRVMDFVERGGRVAAQGYVFRRNERDRNRNTEAWDALACGEKRGPGAGCVEAIPAYDVDKREENLKLLDGIIKDKFGVAAPEMVITGTGGAPALGVEYRSVKLEDGRRLAFAFNALETPAEIKIADGAGEPIAAAKDLFTGRDIEAETQLAPLEIVMYYF